MYQSFLNSHELSLPRGVLLRHRPWHRYVELMTFKKDIFVKKKHCGPLRGQLAASEDNKKIGKKMPKILKLHASVHIWINIK